MSATFVFAKGAGAEYDRPLAWAALLLAATGLVMVYSASIAAQLTSEISAHWLSQCFRGEPGVIGDVRQPGERTAAGIQ